MLVSVIDLRINNLTSVINSFSKKLLPSDDISVFDPNSIILPDLLILPGLGNFEAGMHSLNKNRLDFKIKELAMSGTKIVGICLGMQLLADKSAESPDIQGLGLIPGHCEKLPSNVGVPVPHMSWNEVSSSNSGIFHSLISRRDFYFTHSYHLLPKNSLSILGYTKFGSINFVSAIKQSNILGFQFHPEKSGVVGLALISEILRWAR